MCLLYVEITVLVPIGPHKLLKSLWYWFKEKFSHFRLLNIYIHKYVFPVEFLAGLDKNALYVIMYNIKITSNLVYVVFIQSPNVIDGFCFTDYIFK